MSESDARDDAFREVQSILYQDGLSEDERLSRITDLVDGWLARPDDHCGAAHSQEPS